MRLLLLILLSAALVPSSVLGYNITKILAEHPNFSTFNHYLTLTHLAAEINRRETITVLAVDNSAMSSLLSKHLSLPTLRNLLSLHLLTDYYGAKKLHQLTGSTALSSSFFQATGAAPGTSGFVNISDHRRGLVTFSADPSLPPSTFVKSVKELPYDLSVIEISAPLSSPDAEAPAAAPAPVNLTAVLSKNGCKLFADLLASTADVLKSFEDTVDGGLTVFCPIDSAVSAFAPKFKNLTADAKTSLLLYHGDPVYNSMQMLKTSNGVTTTLATEGRKKSFNFTVQDDGEQVTLETRVTTAKIAKTILDQEPLAVYSIDKVLQPRELFKRVVEVEAEAPAPEADAPAAAKGKGKKKKKGVASPPAPEGPDGAPSDDAVADQNGADGARARWAAALVAATVAAVML